MGEAWHAEPLQGTPTRQPPTQPEARELLASAWALSMGVGPSRDRTSDDTAQNAESSCSGSDETAPPGEKKSLAQGRAPLTYYRNHAARPTFTSFLLSSDGGRFVYESPAKSD